MNGAFWREALRGEVEDHSSLVRQLLDVGALTPVEVGNNEFCIS